MSTKTKHPRPNRRLRKDTTLEKLVAVRIADDDFERIREAAAAAGVPASTWMRNIAVGTACMDPKDREQITANMTAAGAAT